MTQPRQATERPGNPGALGRSDGPPDALPIALEVAVALRIEELRDWPPDARVELARLQADMLASHGDDLMFGGKHCANTFNALAVALACAAYQPGGVTLFGCHWEAQDPRGSCSIVDP